MEKVGRFLDRSVTYLSYLGAAIGGASIVIMLFMITVGVVLRYVFNSPLKFVDEYGAYLMVVLVFMGLAYNARKEAHINVDLVVRRLSKRVRDGLDVVTSLFALVLMGLYLWYDWNPFISHLRARTRDGGVMNTPLWIPEMFMLIGLLFVCLEIVVHIVKKLRDFQKGLQKEPGPNVLRTPGE